MKKFTSSVIVRLANFFEIEDALTERLAQESKGLVDKLGERKLQMLREFSKDTYSRFAKLDADRKEHSLKKDIDDAKSLVKQRREDRIASARHREAQRDEARFAKEFAAFAP